MSASFRPSSAISSSTAASNSLAPTGRRHSFIWSRSLARCWQSRSWANSCTSFTPSVTCWCSLASRSRPSISFLKSQRLDLLHVRNLPHFGEHLGRHAAVDLDQRDGVAALRLAAEMKRRDIDAGLGKERSKPSDEPGFVLIGHVQHRWREFGVHADALDVDDTRPAV